MTKRPLILLSIPLVAAGVLAGCGDDSSPGDEPRKVTVIGTGEVTGVPDTVTASVGIEAEGADVSTALNEANTKITAVTDAVVKAGVKKEDVQTQQVSLSPRYTRPGPGQTSGIGGYTATNTLTIKVRDIGAASDALTAAVNAGGDNTRINSVGLSIDDDAALLKQARTRAFTDARTRAEQYASLSKDTLGPVLSIDEQVSGAAPKTYSRESAVDAAVPISPGQQTLTFTVTVSFTLK